MNSVNTQQNPIELDVPDFINAITELGLNGSEVCIHASMKSFNADIKCGKLQWQKAIGSAIRRQPLSMYVKNISKMIRILLIAATNIATDATMPCVAVQF